MFCHFSPKGFIRLAEGFNPVQRLGTFYWQRINGEGCLSDQGLFTSTQHRQTTKQPIPSNVAALQMACAASREACASVEDMEPQTSEST